MTTVRVAAHRDYANEMLDAVNQAAVDLAPFVPLRSVELAQLLADLMANVQRETETDAHGGNYIGNQDRLNQLEADFTDLEARVVQLEESG